MSRHGLQSDGRTPVQRQTERHALLGNDDDEAPDDYDQTQTDEGIEEPSVTDETVDEAAPFETIQTSSQTIRAGGTKPSNPNAQSLSDCPTGPQPAAQAPSDYPTSALTNHA